MEKKIGFWGVPNPQIVKDLKEQYPNLEWVDLDIDFGHPETNILPDAYCKIIKNIINNSIAMRNELAAIAAPIGKDKCDSGWFAAKVLKDLDFNVIESIFEDLSDRREPVISTSNLPLFDKVNMIMNNLSPSSGSADILDHSKETKQSAGLLASVFGDAGARNSDPLWTHVVPRNDFMATVGQPDRVPSAPRNDKYQNCKPEFGFWGVPPNDLEILKLFPDTTHIYGWTRCAEMNVPADIDLEMYVDENVPTVFYSQAFCSKCQLAKYLADKYNGLYIDIDDVASNSVRAKIEAFLRLR